MAKYETCTCEGCGYEGSPAHDIRWSELGCWLCDACTEACIRVDRLMGKLKARIREEPAIR